MKMVTYRGSTYEANLKPDQVSGGLGTVVAQARSQPPQTAVSSHCTSKSKNFQFGNSSKIKFCVFGCMYVTHLIFHKLKSLTFSFL